MDNSFVTKQGIPTQYTDPSEIRRTEIQRTKDVLSSAIDLSIQVTDAVNRIVGTLPEDKNSAIGPTAIPNGILEDLGATAANAERCIRSGMDSLRRLEQAI